MSIPAGTRLEHYEIVGPLGAGGMGEVYRAHDTKLKREVALKILPAQFVRDESRLARFEREAQLLASLNHPNIAAIYGFEHARGANLPEYPDGPRFLVLELVEGPTLAERLEAGRMDVPEALRIATQIADAMEAAHDKGVLHRDLKPANVKLTETGKVKVLDFGLAKAMSGPELSSRLSDSTITKEETRAGIVMGTASYMSPEQASGKPTDKRTDIWSFGVVLFEMLTGVKPFDGKTTAHIIVHVLEQTPDWSALPPLPSGIRELLEGCLQKDPSMRRRDIGDVRVQLQVSITQPVRIQQAATAPAATTKRRWLWPAVAGVALVVLSGAAGTYNYLHREAPAAPAMRFEIARQGGISELAASVVSPDGRKLTFIARGVDGRTALWVRSLDTSEAHPFDGSDGATGVPFWSPDSRFIVFSVGDKILKIEASGGPAQTLCIVAGGSQLLSGFWTGDGKLVLGFNGAPSTHMVPAAGGTPIPIPAMPEGWNVMAFPVLLPDGKHFIFASNGPPDRTGVFMALLTGGGKEAPVRLLPDVTSLAYAPSANPSQGFLLFVRSESNGRGTLVAQTFDVKGNQLTGDAMPLAENVNVGGFSVSQTGVLVHSANQALSSSTAAGTRGVLTWLDRTGKVLGTAGPSMDYALTINLSPDGTRVATSHGGDVWVYEFSRGVDTRLTFEPGGELAPQWSRDGSRIIYATNVSEGNSRLFEKPSNGAGAAALFYEFTGPALVLPGEWSPNGRFLSVSPGGAAGDAYVLPAEGTAQTRKPLPLVVGRFNERGVRFASSGKFFSYTSDETGKDEAYVRPFDPMTGTVPGGQWIVSKGGGVSPHWRGDGKEMFYMAPDGTLMSVEIDMKSGFLPGAPKPLFKVPAAARFWDVTHDGQKFLIPVPESAMSVEPYRVVLNWTSTLKR